MAETLRATNRLNESSERTTKIAVTATDKQLLLKSIRSSADFKLITVDCDLSEAVHIN